MTTLVALTTKDAVAMGCDSLATASRPLVDPFRLAEFFDPENGFRLRVDQAGESGLRDFGQVMGLAEVVPYNHMTDVDKLMDLSPLLIGFMYTGITSIGNRTIKSLIGEFKETDTAFAGETPTYTVEEVAGRLKDHLRRYYVQEFESLLEYGGPPLEFLVAGYDSSGRLPTVVRVNVGLNQDLKHDGLGIAFAGQMREIQRIVFGIDEVASALLEERYGQLLQEFAEAIRVLNGGDGVTMPEVQEFARRYQLFGPIDPDREDAPSFSLPGFEAEWGDFSEQNAIDCVAYFVGIMREGQRFSSRMPVVGGPIHVAIITRHGGFQFVSREEYRHEDHRVQRAPRRA